jgi:hypothetical protein
VQVNGSQRLDGCIYWFREVSGYWVGCVKGCGNDLTRFYMDDVRRECLATTMLVLCTVISKIA